MNKKITAVVWLVSLLFGGCLRSAIDISGVKSEKELDQFLGKRVTFTGKWMNYKESGMSNGHVFIDPDLAFWGGVHSYQIGSSETVTGYLGKSVVDYSRLHPASPDKPSVQPPAPGNHYFIEKDHPTSSWNLRR